MSNAVDITEEEKRARKDTDEPTFLVRPSRILPRLTAPLRRLIKRKKRMFQPARAKNDWSAFCQFQKHRRRELQRAGWQYINGTIQEGLASNNTKPFWCYIRSRKQDCSGIAPLREDGQLHSDSQTKADILLKQFKSVLTTATATTIPNLKKPTNHIRPIHVDTHGVAKLLHQLNPNKASGPDNIPNWLLKNLADDIALILIIIFQTSLDTGHLPQDWLRANISCAYKKGDPHTPSHYLPISLTSVCCKLLEHIVCRQIMSHLEQQKILTNLNHGFRSGFSTETQLPLPTICWCPLTKGNKWIWLYWTSQKPLIRCHTIVSSISWPVTASPAPSIPGLPAS